MSRKDGGLVAMNDIGFFNVKNDDTYGINKKQKRKKKSKKFKQELLTDKAVRRTHVILNHTRKNSSTPQPAQKSLIQAPQPVVALFDSFLRYLSSNPALRPLISLVLRKDASPAPAVDASSTTSQPSSAQSLGHLSSYGYNIPRI